MSTPTPPSEPQALRDLADTVLARPEYSGPTWSPARILGLIGPDLEALTAALYAAASEIERLREDCLTWESQHAAVLSLCDRLQGAIDRAVRVEQAARELIDADTAMGRADVENRSDDLALAFIARSEASRRLYDLLDATTQPSAGTETGE